MSYYTTGTAGFGAGPPSCPPGQAWSYVESRCMLKEALYGCKKGEIWSDKFGCLPVDPDSAPIPSAPALSPALDYAKFATMVAAPTPARAGTISLSPSGADAIKKALLASAPASKGADSVVRVGGQTMFVEPEPGDSHKTLDDVVASLSTLLGQQAQAQAQPQPQTQQSCPAGYARDGDLCIKLPEPESKILGMEPRTAAIVGGVTFLGVVALVMATRDK